MITMQEREKLKILYKEMIAMRIVVLTLLTLWFFIHWDMFFWAFIGTAIIYIRKRAHHEELWKAIKEKEELD